MVLPLVGVVPMLLGDERTAKRTALVVTLLELVFSLGLWWAFDHSGRRDAARFPALPGFLAWGISYG